MKKQEDHKPGKPHTVHTFCRICESLCGLEVTVQDNKILETMWQHRGSVA
jgi:anaerobic selenocysteine-containing dehydrogenase